jgi:hypothetical protein
MALDHLGQTMPSQNVSGRIEENQHVQFSDHMPNNELEKIHFPNDFELTYLTTYF